MWQRLSGFLFVSVFYWSFLVSLFMNIATSFSTNMWLTDTATLRGNKYNSYADVRALQCGKLK